MDARVNQKSKEYAEKIEAMLDDIYACTREGRGIMVGVLTKKYHPLLVTFLRLKDVLHVSRANGLRPGNPPLFVIGFSRPSDPVKLGAEFYWYQLQYYRIQQKPQRHNINNIRDYRDYTKPTSNSTEPVKKAAPAQSNKVDLDLVNKLLNDMAETRAEAERARAAAEQAAKEARKKITYAEIAAKTDELTKAEARKTFRRTDGEGTFILPGDKVAIIEFATMKTTIKSNVVDLRK